MSSFSISGLSSGIDTSSLIDQLMTVAARPQTQLKNQLAAEQTTGSAYQALVTSLSALTSALVSLGASSTSQLLPSTGPTAWSAVTVASSSPAVVASGTAGAVPGATVTFDVKALAQAQTTTVATSNGIAVSNPGTGIDITGADGTVHHVALTDGSAAGVAAAINAATIGVHAQAVTTDGGTVLRLTSTSTGKAGGFTASGFDATPSTVLAAQDAQIAVGDPAAGGYTMSSSSNTFTGVEDGVTFTVGSLASSVTLSVGSDTGRIADGVAAAITAVNAVLTSLGQSTGKGGVLNGDSTVRNVAQSLLATVSDGNNGGSFAGYGIALTSTGTMTFDRTAFLAALTSSPSGTQAAVGTTLANRLSAVVDGLTDPRSGTLTNALTSLSGQESDLTNRISDWDSRLADQRTALTAKYAAMEAALSKLNSQSSYLTSVFNSMNGTSSSSSSSH